MVDLKIKLPDGFLNSEERMGYTISTKLKKVWAVEFDLLAEFDRVCQKYNIKYCAEGGTLLGAVRHHGMIPWDDDIDIAMRRSEFNKLNKIASNEFQYPYFWQTEETDPGSARGHAQLRNSQTTGILRQEYETQRNNNNNQGIFIDIFPFDNIPDNSKELKKFDAERLKLHQKYMDIILSNNYVFPCISIDKNGKKHYGIRRLYNHIKYKLLGINDYTKVYQNCMYVYQQYDKLPNTKYVANLCVGSALKKRRRYREDFDDLIWVDFEFLKIPIFKNYDRNLRLCYGDNYMTPIFAKNLHGAIIFDTDRPYTVYLEKRNRKYSQRRHHI